MQIKMRVTESDIAYLNAIMENDCRCERLTDAVRIAVNDIYEKCISDKVKLMDWQKIKNVKVPELTNFQMLNEELGPKNFTVDDEKITKIVNALKDALGAEKIRYSYLLRLCIKAKLMEINGMSLFSKVDEEINKIELVMLFTELLMKSDSASKEKIRNIAEILGY